MLSVQFSSVQSQVMFDKIYIENIWQDFPGGSVVSFPFQCRGCRFNSWSRSQDPTCLVAKKPKHKNRSNTVTDTIKNFKMVPIKKSLKKNKKERKKENTCQKIPETSNVTSEVGVGA